MPKQLFSDIMMNMQYQNTSVQDLIGQLFINGRPQAYVSYYDTNSGYSMKRDIRIKYFAPINGLSEKIRAQYFTLDKKHRNSNTSWIDCDEEQYNDFNNQLTLAGLFNQPLSILSKNNNSDLGTVSVLKLGLGVKSKKLVFVESHAYKDMCDFVLNGKLPENTVVCSDDVPINLQVDHSYDNIINTNMMNMILGNYLVTTKSLNSRINYSNLILPSQAAYLPFLYHGSKVRCPILERLDYKSNYDRLFGDLDAESQDIQIFPGIPESYLSCKVITNKRACEILGLNTVYPLTGYMLTYIITCMCMKIKVDLSSLLDSELEYFSQYASEIKLHFGSIAQFKASLEADLSTTLGVG